MFCAYHSNRFKCHLSVLQAYERRFPTCPQMPIVLDCVVTEDTVDGSRRHTKRRCKLKVDAPYIFKKIIGIDVCYFIQENFLDLKERKLTIEATNETFSSRIKIFEKCRYYVHPENPNWTCFDQTANIEITNFFGFEHQMEKVGMKQYTQMTLKGKEIIEFFIDELKAEGITHIDIWQDVEGSQNEVRTDEIVDELKEQQRLDADYIKKYLGELTPLQESRLHQLRKKIEDQNLDQVMTSTQRHLTLLLSFIGIICRYPTTRHFYGFFALAISTLKRHQQCLLSH